MPDVEGEEAEVDTPMPCSDVVYADDHTVIVPLPDDVMQGMLSVELVSTCQQAWALMNNQAKTNVLAWTVGAG